MRGPAADAAATSHCANFAAIGWAVLKLAALVAIVLLAGSRIVPWILTQVATPALARAVHADRAGAVDRGGRRARIALRRIRWRSGAFLAGMVVGQSPVSHQAAADALPMRDAFAVLFFVSVGMLFDPAFLVAPAADGRGRAWHRAARQARWPRCIIVATLGYSARTALTVAIGLAQIGEFSFILSQVARDHHLMSEDGHTSSSRAAIISITLNPLAVQPLDRPGALAAAVGRSSGTCSTPAPIGG